MTTKTTKKLSKKALNKSFWRWTFGNLSSMSFEWLESFGFADAMAPVIEELYEDDQEEIIKALQRHSTFYNTEPQTGTIINGIVCGLEEERANGSGIDDEMINSIKVGLMGPIAGIGDAMVPGMLIPLLLSIAMGLSTDGSIIGPIFYVVTYIPIILIVSYTLFRKGYELGTSAVDVIVGSVANRVRESFNLLGAIVVGGVAASYVALSVNWTIPTGLEGESIIIDDIINGIFPKLLPLALVLICWVLMSKKKVSPLMMMGILVVVAIVGVFLGAF